MVWYDPDEGDKVQERRGWPGTVVRYNQETGLLVRFDDCAEDDEDREVWVDEDGDDEWAWADEAATDSERSARHKGESCMTERACRGDAS